MMNIGNQQQSQLVEETLHAAARILCQAALDLIEKDPHQWSKRPCTTCQTVSVLIGRPFGCSKMALER